jgi:murein DD-endopeptidase MepM/ murein hydrolase activator NlpD
VNDDRTRTDVAGSPGDRTPASEPRAQGDGPTRGRRPRSATPPATGASPDPLAAIRDIELPPIPQRAGDVGGRGDSSDEPGVDHVEVGRAQRADRQASVRARRRTTTVAFGLVAAAVAVVLIALGAILLPHEPATTRVFASQGSGPQVKKASSAAVQAPIVSTPQFARLGHMAIYLPIEPKAITGVAFHQSAYGRSYHMISLVPNADRARIFNLVKAGKKLPIACAVSAVTGIDQRDGQKVVDSTWKGSVVRLYRTGRSGYPDSAADTGAKAGTTVIAPASGTVERIRPYKLYGRYPDYEIHIRPDGMRQADLVVIHVQDVIAKPGEHVTGGITPIAHVRLLSNQLVHQLGEYTGDPGDHVHIQFNWPKTADAADTAG